MCLLIEDQENVRCKQTWRVFEGRSFSSDAKLIKIDMGGQIQPVHHWWRQFTMHAVHLPFAGFLSFSALMTSLKALYHISSSYCVGVLNKRENVGVLRENCRWAQTASSYGCVGWLQTATRRAACLEIEFRLKREVHHGTPCKGVKGQFIVELE